jgi:cytidylate kinase
MIEKGQPASYQEVLENLLQRDHQDSTRAASPLTRAEDAVDLDNSRMTPDEQMLWFEKLLEKKRKEWERTENKKLR